MAEVHGLLFDIQSFSVHDGPGCRTTLFLLGCPLRCAWCANPEGWELRRRMLFRAARCTHGVSGCVRCVARCPHQAVRSGAAGEEPLIIDWERCRTCRTLECTQACLKEAMVVCGREYSVDELLKLLNRDRHYWGTSGGVTFSGGEPLVQLEFLTAMLRCCQEAYIHTAIETSACVPTEQFLPVMQSVNFAFVDIKHMNSERHKEKTGVSNRLVLENLTTLAASDWSGRLVVRVPVIPGFNSSDDNMVATAHFVKQLGLAEINLLPFHRLGESKWRQCGLEYPYREQEPPQVERMEQLRKLVTEQGINCFIGSDTPF